MVVSIIHSKYNTVIDCIVFVTIIIHKITSFLVYLIFQSYTLFVHIGSKILAMEKPCSKCSSNQGTCSMQALMICMHYVLTELVSIAY